MSLVGFGVDQPDAKATEKDNRFQFQRGRPMLKTFKRTLSGRVCLLLGGGGLWFCATEPFEEEVEELPDYDWIAEIRELQAEGRLGEAEQLGLVVQEHHGH